MNAWGCNAAFFGFVSRYLESPFKLEVRLISFSLSLKPDLIPYIRLFFYQIIVGLGFFSLRFFQSRILVSLGFYEVE